ncbi:MAG: lytic murein transglycosylase [Rhodoferax sp.]|nr:lytic murein transglycosylase [Rhodoferax sp.]
MRLAAGLVSLIALLLAACAGGRPVEAGAPVAPRATERAGAQGGAVASASSADPAFAKWLADFKAEAAAQGIRPAIIEAALRDVRPVEKVVSRDRNQAEFTLTFETYRDRVLTPVNVAAGRRKLAQHGPLLAAVAAKYGVQPRFILAIWGIETRYGAVKPTMPVMPALATLAYDGRRSAFFRNEMMQALRMLDAGYADAPDLMGSWAGAMGQPQFMPSSYMKFAQDWDGDGRRDIWNNPGDVFASIAYYLASNGWSDAQTWGRQVKLSSEVSQALPQMQLTGKSGCRAMDQLSVARSLKEWQAQGVRRADGADLPALDLQAALALPEAATGPAFVVYGNYEAILRYNCAHYYALTVGALSDRIGGG